MTDPTEYVLIPRAKLEALLSDDEPLAVGQPDEEQQIGRDQVRDEVRALLAAARPVVDAGEFNTYQNPRECDAGLVARRVEDVDRLNAMEPGTYRVWVEEEKG